MDWKRYLVAANYYGTLPFRVGANRLAGCRGRMPVMILFYHRVADCHRNAWTISRELFARQIDWLQAHFELIPLATAQQRIRQGSNSRPAVCITFDDGYAENCDFALPLLVSRRIPCTYFVATDHVFRARPFPHDLACGQPLPPNSLDELRALLAAGIEVGCHTRTHVDLSAVRDPHVLQEEIETSGWELASRLGAPIRYFAVPYGQPQHLTPQAMHVARQAGYQGVCSAYGGYNFPGGEAFHLRRIHADPDLLRFRNWLTFDRIKLLRRAAQADNRRAPSMEVAEVDHASIC